MKKSSLPIFIFIFFALLGSGCKQKPLDIKTTELVTPCDFLGAIEKCVYAALDLVGQRDLKDLSEEEMTLMQALKRKAKEIEKVGKRRGFTRADLKECEDYPTFIERAKDIEKYW